MELRIEKHISLDFWSIHCNVNLNVIEHNLIYLLNVRCCYWYALITPLKIVCFNFKKNKNSYLNPLVIYTLEDTSVGLALFILLLWHHKAIYLLMIFSTFCPLATKTVFTFLQNHLLNTVYSSFRIILVISYFKEIVDNYSPLCCYMNTNWYEFK